VHHGYQGLFLENPVVKIFDFHHADRIFSRGGSTLIMSRFKPKDSDFKVDFFKKNNVKLLVTIGGDDTVSTANRLSKGDITPLFLKDFEDKNGKIPPRLVDVNSDMVQLFINNLYYIQEKDYKQAKKYVSNPEMYDFKKILNLT